MGRLINKIIIIHRNLKHFNFLKQTNIAKHVCASVFINSDMFVFSAFCFTSNFISYPFLLALCSLLLYWICSYTRHIHVRTITQILSIYYQILCVSVSSTKLWSFFSFWRSTTNNICNFFPTFFFFWQ